MEGTTPVAHPLITLSLYAVTVLAAYLANTLDIADNILSFISKAAPIITTIMILIVNYKTLAKNIPEIFKLIKKRWKKSK